MYDGAIVYTTVMKYTAKTNGHQRTPTTFDKASTTKRGMKFQWKFTETRKMQDSFFSTSEAATM